MFSRKKNSELTPARKSLDKLDKLHPNPYPDHNRNPIQKSLDKQDLNPDPIQIKTGLLATTQKRHYFIGTNFRRILRNMLKSKFMLNNPITNPILLHLVHSTYTHFSPKIQSDNRHISKQ
jgi:hypothetical protein